MRRRASSFRIRRAREEDVPGILRCLRVAFAPYRSEYSPGAFIDTVLTKMTARERLTSMHVLVAVEGPGEVVGSIAWGPESETIGHLRGMAVVPRRQGSGIAQALLDRALHEMARRGYRRVTLDTTAPLHRAVRFYRRNGFRPSGRVSDFFGMPLIERARRVGRDFRPGTPPKALDRGRKPSGERFDAPYESRNH